MKKLLVALLCSLTFPAIASHIVGGEFEFIHIQNSNFLYQVNLIVYFDEINGNQPAKDQNIRASIYRKRDNAFMRFVDFNGFTQTPVSYSQPACSNGEIKTSRLAYSTTITLPADQYGDPGGYYLIWERCCRNYSITNIVSNDPAGGGLAAGQTFYLEFPPVVKNGQPFINSSPRLFPALSDYACPLKFYYVDFAGIDDDGDLLVYSLVTPLSTHSSESVPAPAPAPYPLVDWGSLFGLTHITNGNPDLKISRDGFLTVRPPRGQGLYVFAVRCEEYRDGVKIGEVRRDFQMKVLDRCADAVPPQILGKKLTDASFGYDGTMSVTFASGINNADRCIQVQVSDLDSFNPQDANEEHVTIKAIPIGFKKNITGILPSVTNAILTNGSTKTFNICFEECPYVEGPFQIGIVASDDACSQPLTDTLKITVNVIPPPNQKPTFITANVEETLNEDQIRTWQIKGIDDGNAKKIPLADIVLTDGFNFQNFGMAYTVISRTDELYEAQLTWDTHCDNYDFSTKTSFNISAIIKDTDYCNFQHTDTMTLKLNVIRPGLDPTIDSDLTPDPQERTVSITKEMYKSLKFTVTGKQDENHFIVLAGKGISFNFQDHGMTFPGSSGNGLVASIFNWDIKCDNVDLKNKDIFDLRFIVADNASKCRIYKADTLDVHVTVKPSINLKPLLTVSSLDLTIPLIENSISIKLGQKISLALNGNDFNTPKDPLKLSLVSATGTVTPVGYEFTSVDGVGHAQGEFSWFPDCSIFENGVYKNDYVFEFDVTDDRCGDSKGDTVAVNISIQDIDQETESFIPPNIVTSNNDPYNEFFAMMKEGETKELVSILPKDNCSSRFEDIRIYNRWGKEIYTSTNRDFKWYPTGESPGVYFYYLHFSNKVYKGSVSVRN